MITGDDLPKDSVADPDTGTDLTALTESKQRTSAGNLKPFRPGQSGNPHGRPKGSRHRFSESFVAALSADFDEHGRSAIEEVRRSDPLGYLAICAKLVPKDVGAVADDTPRRHPNDYTNAELVEIIERADGVVRPVLNVTIDRRELAKLQENEEPGGNGSREHAA